MTVLIIEDNDLVARATARALQAKGWSVIRGVSPCDVDDLQGEADVILSDWRLQNGGGAEVLERALRPVVFYSGTAHEIPEALHAIWKPATGDTLDTELRKATKDV